MSRTLYFFGGLFCAVILLLIISLLGFIPSVISTEEYELGKSLSGRRVFVDGKPYVIFIGFEGGSNAYRGDAALLENRGNCTLKINRITYSKLQNGGKYYYIFPEKSKCLNIK